MGIRNPSLQALGVEGGPWGEPADKIRETVTQSNQAGVEGESWPGGLHKHLPQPPGAHPPQTHSPAHG